MCDVSRKQRRAFRDRDPPRISGEREGAGNNLLASQQPESSKSTPNSPIALQRASSLEKCFSEPEFEKQREQWRRRIGETRAQETSTSCSSVPESEPNDHGAGHGANGRVEDNMRGGEDFLKELSIKVPLSGKRASGGVITNGLRCNSDSCDGLTNGRKMAPVLGVPPPPPPAPHMGPDGLILPRKPYNPCLTSTNHKDLHRELLFNQKVGRNVLNQKSELQRALEKQREAASRKEAERNREESYKDDPRTALQRAIEQRAKHIQLTQEQSQPSMDPANNLLITARAKLRPRTDSQ